MFVIDKLLPNPSMASIQLPVYARFSAIMPPFRRRTASQRWDPDSLSSRVAVSLASVPDRRAGAQESLSDKGRKAGRVRSARYAFFVNDLALRQSRQTTEFFYKERRRNGVVFRTGTVQE